MSKSSSGNGKSSDSSQQWLVKLDNDQLKGPYSTEALIKMIIDGYLSGQEDVSEYPDGDWKPISKEVVFYEAILSSLENPQERDEKNLSKIEAETVIRIPSATVEVDEKKKTEQIIFELLKQNNSESQKPVSPDDTNKTNRGLTSSVKSQLPAIQQTGATKTLVQQQAQQQTIELEKIKDTRRSVLRKIIPAAIIFLIIAIAGLLYFDYEEANRSKFGWILISAQSNKNQLSEAEIKNLKQKAISNIRSGVLENVIQAQIQLVQLIGGTDRDLEATGLLCMSHYLLWPYTKQTAKDLKAILVTTQQARTMNPLSNYSDACQAVYLFTKGQTKDARAIVEKTIDQKNEENFILAPFLYFFKAELLEDQQNFIHAEPYYRESLKLFPEWKLAQFGIARMLYKQNKYNEARAEYEQILAKMSDYKAALFGLALTELKSQNNFDKVFELFNQGYIKQNKILKNFHIEALQEYIKILIEKGDSKKALEVAQVGLNLNPNHRALKEVIISLGGNENSTSTNGASELILVGDQFVRNEDHLAAQAQYKAAFDIDNKNSMTAIKIAKSLWALNQVREAHVWLDKALEIDSSNLTAYSLKSDYLTQKYNFTEAAKVLAKASQKAPQSYDVLKSQALVEVRKNNMSSAATYAEKAFKKYDADIELITMLANAYTVLYENASTRTQEEQTKSENFKSLAQKYSTKAVDLEPGWPEAQITYAKYVKATSSASNAENYLQALVKNYPYTSDYKIALAEFYETEEKFSSAAQIYQKLIEAEPKNKKANYGLARCNRLMNKIEDAKKFYLQAAIIDPSDVEPLFMTAQIELEQSGVSRNKQQELGKALNKLQMVKKINPNYPKISYYIAKGYLMNSEYAKAIEMIAEEKSKNPNLADPYILAAEVYTEKSQFTDCAVEYSAAIKLRPNSADLYIKAATCYRKSDALEIAQDMLEMAKQIENGNPLLFRERGLLHQRLGNTKEAIKNLNDYLGLSPNALDRAEIESTIKNLGG